MSNSTPNSNPDPSSDLDSRVDSKLELEVQIPIFLAECQIIWTVHQLSSSKSPSVFTTRMNQRRAARSPFWSANMIKFSLSWSRSLIGSVLDTIDIQIEFIAKIMILLLLRTSLQQLWWTVNSRADLQTVIREIEIQYLFLLNLDSDIEPDFCLNATLSLQSRFRFIVKPGVSFTVRLRLRKSYNSRSRSRFEHSLWFRLNFRLFEELAYGNTFTSL